MMDILTRRGIIGPEFEKRANELAIDLNAKIERLETIEDLEEKQQASIEVATAREELYQWNQRLSGPMNNTCESMADDARLEYLTSCMVQKKDGTRVWDSYDSFLTDRTNALPIKARFEVMLFLQGLDSDFLNQTPEALAMKEVEDELISKAEEAIKAAEAVQKEETEKDIDTDSDDESSDKVKPKTTRRKRSTSKKTDE
jgi:hypothetical protein